MVTLGTWFIGVGVANALIGGTAIRINDKLVRSLAIERDPLVGLPWGVWLALFCFLVALVIQNYTRLGRYIYALGGGEDLAALSGIPASRVRIMAFTLAGVFYAVGGILAAAQLGLGNAQIGIGRLFTTITAVVVGGTALSGGQGGVQQTLVGVLIVVVLSNGMVLMGIPPERPDRRPGADDHRRRGAVDGPQADADREMSAPAPRPAPFAGRRRQALPRRPCPQERLDRHHARRGGRPDRRERRRQVDADEDPAAASTSPTPARSGSPGSRPASSAPPTPTARASAWSSRSSRCSPISASARTSISATRRSSGASGWSTGRRSTPPPRRQLEKVEVDVDPRTHTSDLGFATRQMVELAKALTLEENAGGHLVILLDEPTSVLERAEIEILFARVRALKSRASFIFVSHRLDEVLELSDRIYVMKDGAVVADLPTAEANVTRPAPAHGRPQPAGRVLPRVPAEARTATRWWSRPRASRLGRFLSRRRLQAPRRRDPRHRRGDRLGPRGGHPHARRLRPARRRPAARRRQGVPAPDPGRSGRQRHRLHSARAAGRRAGAVPVGRRQHHPRQPPQPDQVRPDQRRARSSGWRRTWVERLKVKTPEHQRALPQPLRRQPAEGRAGQVAERQGAGADPRPSDPRARRRRQGGGLRTGPRR